MLKAETYMNIYIYLSNHICENRGSLTVNHLLFLWRSLYVMYAYKYSYFVWAMFVNLLEVNFEVEGSSNIQASVPPSLTL